MDDSNALVLADLDREKLKKIDRQLDSFRDIVKKIEGLSDDKRVLYTEIYENAIVDRQTAAGLMRVLVEICGTNTAEHAIHARSIATFIERMSRANEQLIKLCELIRRAEEQDDIDPEEMFNSISRR